MKKICSLLISASLLCTPVIATATEGISIALDGQEISLNYQPVIVEGRTMVHLRSFAHIFGYNITWNDITKSITLFDNSKSVQIYTGSPFVTITENDKVTRKVLEVAPLMINNYTYLPLRDVAEIFGTQISWNDALRRVEMTTAYTSANITDIADDTLILPPTQTPIENTNKSASSNHTFYFQNEERWQLPNYGSSYCWVMCYAMVLNDVVGNVTPTDVALVNEEMCGNGAYCYYFQIVERFGAKFAPAVDTNSPYFESYTDGHATYIKNPDKDDSVAVNAIKEALTLHPEGVMVRFETYPHTIVAVDYEGDTIYYNEPQPSSYGEYSNSSPYERVEFEKTYPASKGLKISDLTFLQAIDK